MAKERKTAQTKPTIDISEAFIFYCTPQEDGRLRSYDDVARHFNVTTRLIERWGSRGTWVKRREDVGKKRVAQWTEDQKTLSEEINKDLFGTWRKMLTLLKYEFDDIDFSQEMSSGTTGVRTGIKRKGARDYREFAEALKNTTDKLRILTGQTTDYTKSDIDANVARQLDDEELSKIDSYLDKLNADRKPQTTNTIPNTPATN